LENLYNSVKFAYAAWTSKNKVKIFGVTWQGGRGIPSCLKQEKETKCEKIIKATGTVKAAKLVGDGGFEEFLCFLFMILNLSILFPWLVSILFGNKKKGRYGVLS